jgi:hypothetical protein
VDLGAAVILRKPDRATLANDEAHVKMLLGFYDAILALQKDRLPSTVPALKSVVRPSYASLRAAAGDINGELGPPATIVTGGTSIKDGGEGVFLWDPDSTLADDGVNVFQVAQITTGRWRRAAM